MVSSKKPSLGALRILRVLSDIGPMNGFEMSSMLEMPRGCTYNTLYRMVHYGWIRRVHVGPQLGKRGGRRTVEYHGTELGFRHLDEIAREFRNV